MRYAAGEPGTIIPHSDSESTLDFRADPDLDIAILAGEAVYQIKSALDHLAFDLVKINETRIQLPLNWIRRCHFPLLLEVPVKGNPPVSETTPLPYNYFHGSLPGISKQAFEFIECIQPYYRRNTGNVLRPLAQLSDIDKHSCLHILNPQGYHTAELTGPKGNYLSVRRAARGDKLKSPFLAEQLDDKGAVYMEHVAHVFVSFDEGVLDKNTAALAVDGILQLCVNEVQGIIIPAFAEFLKNP